MSGTERELRAHQLGSALRGLAAELVEERRKVADLRREVAELRQRLEALQKAQGSEDAEAGGAGSRPRAPDRAAIYLTVGLSVFAHGLSAAPLADRYARWYQQHPRDQPANGERPHRRHAPPRTNSTTHRGRDMTWRPQGRRR